MRWSVEFLAFAQAVFVLAACSAAAGTSTAPASISPAPIDSPPPNPSPEPPPSEAAAPTEPVVDSVPIPPDTYARVVTDDLRVRSNPVCRMARRSSNRSFRTAYRWSCSTGRSRLLATTGISSSQRSRLTPQIHTHSAGSRPLSRWRAMDRAGDRRMPTACLRVSSNWRDEPGGMRCSWRSPASAGRTSRSRRDFGCRRGLCGGSRGDRPVWLDIVRGAMRRYLRAGEGVARRPGVDRGRCGRLTSTSSTVPEQRVPQADMAARRGDRDVRPPGGRDVPKQAQLREAGDARPDPAMTILRCRMKFVVTSMREVEG